MSFALVTQRALDVALLAGVGVAALAMSSAEAFTIVKLVGRRTWWCWTSGHSGTPARERAEPQGGAIYLTLAPQFRR